MLRRASLALFVLALGLAVACGRQVTPSPTSNNNLSGTVTIKFRTAAAFDFTQFNYWIVFNTSGQGGEPYANGFQTGYKNYSYAFQVGVSTGGAGTLLPVLYQFYVVPGVGPRVQQFNVNPSLTSLQLNTNGQGTEFTLIFARSQLALAPPTGPSSTPSAGPTPTRSPTPLPTPTPTGSAQPSSAPSPQSSPTASSQSTWFVNLFTTDATNHVLDALGLGPTDQSFTSGQFDVNSLDQIVYSQPAELNPPNPAAQLAGVEIDNNP